MFGRAEIQAALDETASLRHKATLNSPYSFEIRPSGFKTGEPSYRVVVERTAFSLKVAAAPDYMAVAIVAAIVAGAKNNPTRVDRLRATLEEAGWEPEVQLTSEGFRLAAERANARLLDDQELTETGTAAALLLSEFVLDQMIVTRTYGELRPAVERSVAEAADVAPWLYDPSERDRSTQVHRSLENWLMQMVRDAGLEPLDPAGEPFFDLAWRLGDRIVVCEVKSTRVSQVHQIRLGLGQVLQYRAMLAKTFGDIVLPALLIESAPDDGMWRATCARAGVELFWPDLWEEVSSALVGGAS